jgi:uncharacterized RDD family membrane protein YckC
MAVSLGRLEVETADHVVLRYDLAGAGTRGSAALIDAFLSLLMVFGLTIAAIFVGARLPPGLGSQLAGVAAFAILASWVAYFVLLEWLWNGQTIGKRRAGLRVIGPDGEPARFTAVLIRNLVRLVDFLPFWYALGVVTIFLTPRSQRLGDLAAGTYVVRAPKPRLDWLSLRTLEPSHSPAAASAPLTRDRRSIRISGESQRLVREFVARERTLSARDRAKLAAVIAGPIRAAAPDLQVPDDAEFLRQVAASLRASGDAPLPAWSRPDDPVSAARGLTPRSQQLVRSFAARERSLEPDVRKRIAASICEAVRPELLTLAISDDVELLRALATALGE